MTTFPRGYRDDCDAMERAARAWCERRPNAQLAFVDIFSAARLLAGLPKDESVWIIGDLIDAIPQWAGSDDARAFLLELVRVTEGRATIMMTRAVMQVVLRDSKAQA